MNIKADSPKKYIKLLPEERKEPMKIGLNSMNKKSKANEKLKSHFMKKRVTGIGGIFLKAKDPKTTYKWYREHLGIKSGQWGGTFEWRHANDPVKKGFTAWSIFDETTEYTHPSKKDVMVNYRVENLEELLKTLKKEGVEVVGEMEVFDYGKFGWIMDPNGYKIELWEPNDDEYDKIKGEVNLSS